VREAYKRKGEDYKLFWPEKAEFVRMAAKFNAIIVPFAAIGAEDSMELVLDGPELERLPFIGDSVRERASRMPFARAGGIESQVEGERFVSPLIRPLAPDRWYFRAMQPIDTSSIDRNDSDAVAKCYMECQTSVSDGIQWLLERRERDQYRDLPPRMLYAATNGGTKEIPTFPLS